MDDEGTTPTLLADLGASCARVVEYALPRSGETVGRFAIEQCIGEGGMGVVYAARDTTLERRVALKFVLPQPNAAPAGMQALVDEARAMARLSHPNVVTIYDVGEWGAHVYLAMELVDGMTLDRWVREHQPDPVETWAVLRRAALGLQAAHAAGLVHRDFKPGNVFVTASGAVRVGDFGLAMRRPRRGGGEACGAVDATDSDWVVGTPAYMAPEQHRAEPVDARADQFAFCVSAYEMFYGRRPWTATDLPSLVQAMCYLPPSPPATVGDAPLELFTVLAVGMRAEPEDRFADMGALIGRLDRLLAPTAVATDVVAGNMTAIWNDRVRAGMRAAFAASGRMHAAESFDLVVQHLDRWTAEWTETRRSLLQEQREAGGEEERGWRGQLRQLDHLALEVGEVVRLLTEPGDASVVDRAPELLYQLPRPARAVLGRTGEVEPSADAAELVRGLARARALYHAGRIDGSAAVAHEVAQRAQAAGDDRLAGRARLLAVLAAMHDVDVDRVDAELGAALEAAARSRDHATLARAWSLRLFALAAYGRVDEALALRPAAETAALATDDEVAQAWVLNDVGVVLYRAGRRDEAIGYFERSIERKEQVLGPRHPDLAISLFNAGHVLLDDGQVARAGALCRRALAILEATLGSFHPLLGNAIHALQEVALAAGEPDQVLALQERVATIRTTRHMRYHHDLCAAEARLARGERDRAGAEARDIIAAVGAGDELYARACFLAARCVADDDVEAARALAERALATARVGVTPAAEEVRQWLAALPGT